jgi:hypothetical protein
MALLPLSRFCLIISCQREGAFAFFDGLLVSPAAMRAPERPRRCAAEKRNELAPPHCPSQTGSRIVAGLAMAVAALLLAASYAEAQTAKHSFPQGLGPRQSHRRLQQGFAIDEMGFRGQFAQQQS